MKNVFYVILIHIKKKNVFYVMMGILFQMMLQIEQNVIIVELKDVINAQVNLESKNVSNVIIIHIMLMGIFILAINVK